MILRFIDSFGMACYFVRHFGAILLLTFLIGISGTLSYYDSDNNSVHSEGCGSYLVKFASETASFTRCAIINARPINLCEACVEQYISVLEAHEEILKLADETGEACRNQLINLDRLEVVEHGFENVQNLWQNGHCGSCFETYNKTYILLSNKTLHFKDLYRSADSCIQQYYFQANKSYDPSVCKSCTDAYCKMNEFYDSLKEIEGDGKICIDIVDSMNTTRLLWSDTLQCGRKIIAVELPLLLSIFIISLTPIAFYIMAKLFSRKVESRVIPQKRLVVHLNCPSTSGLVS